MQNSETKKQAITDSIERIVDREIYTNCSYLISELMTNEKYMEDLMQVCSIYLDNSDQIDALKDRVSDLENERDDQLSELDDFEDDFSSDDAYQAYYEEYDKIIIDHYDALIAGAEDEQSDLESEQEYPIEALEHWIVSDWLAGKLAEHGQMVMDFNSLWIWGRTTSGQGIAMDYIMQQIAEDLHNARY